MFPARPMICGNDPWLVGSLDWSCVLWPWPSLGCMEEQGLNNFSSVVILLESQDVLRYFDDLHDGWLMGDSLHQNSLL